MIRFSKYGLIVLILAGLMIGSALAVTVTPIFSNVVSTTVMLTAWAGTLTLSNLAANYTVGQQIALSAYLNPIPTTSQNQQNVTFYYSELSSITLSTPITGNATTGLVLLGSAMTVNGVAQLTLNPTVNGTYYFIAAVLNPD